MLNDVSFPPLEEQQQVTPRREKQAVKPVFEVRHPVADVTLFDHPDFAPSGAGNFWLLGIVGILVLALVLLVLWVMI